MRHLPAQVISYSAGVLNSFVLNRKWTFRVAHGTTVTEVVKLLGVVVNYIGSRLWVFADQSQHQV